MQVLVAFVFAQLLISIVEIEGATKLYKLYKEEHLDPEKIKGCSGSHVNQCVYAKLECKKFREAPKSVILPPAKETFRLQRIDPDGYIVYEDKDTNRAIFTQGKEKGNCMVNFEKDKWPGLDRSVIPLRRKKHRATHVFIEIRVAAPVHDVPPFRISYAPALLGNYEERKRNYERGRRDQTTIVEYSIMFYFTIQAARISPDILTDLTKYINVMNDVYARSQIPLRARIHCYEETSVDEDLFENENLDPTLLAEGVRNIKESREATLHSADIAILILANGFKVSRGVVIGAATGVLSIEAGDTFGWARGINVFRDNVLAHEIGHMFGLCHNIEIQGLEDYIIKYTGDLFCKWPMWMSWNPLGRYNPYGDFAHGHWTRYLGVMTGHYTVMAYREQGAHIPTNQFSSPYRTVKDEIYDEPIPLGDEWADASRVLTETRFVAASVGDEKMKCQKKIEF